MGNIIVVIKVIGYLITILAIRDAFKMFRKDKSLLKLYIKCGWDWVWGFLLVISVLVSIGFIISLNPPFWLKFSWISFISGGQSQNLVTSPMTSGYVPLVILFWVLMTFSLPYLAKMEEVMFREGVIDLGSRIKKSIIFGMVHMVMGIPLFVAMLLCITGFIFSIRYCKVYRVLGSEEALLASTSLHMKYNFIIITIGCLSVIFL